MTVPLNQKRWGGYVLAAVVGALTATTAIITTLTVTTLNVTTATATTLIATNASSSKQEVNTLRVGTAHATGTISGTNLTMSTANITSASGTTLIFTSASSASMISGVNAGNRAFTIASTSTWIDFASVPAGRCSATSSVVLTGVTSNTACNISVTPSNAVYNSATNTRAEGYATAVGAVAVRLCNTDSSVATANPDNGIYTIKAECY